MLLVASTIGTPRLEFKVEHTHEVSFENVLRQIAEERRQRQIEAPTVITAEIAASEPDE